MSAFQISTTTADTRSTTARERGSRTYFGLFLLALWAAGIIHTAFSLTYRPLHHGTVPYLGGFDENGYYAIARSLFFDEDLNFANEFGFIRATQPHYLAEAFEPYIRENPRAPLNIYPAGTALAALPALQIARSLDLVRSALTGAPPASGFSLLYVLAYCAAQITYGIGALYLGWRILRRWFPPAVAALACCLTVLTGSYLFYQVFNPGMSHLAGAFFVTAAIGLWLKGREQTGWRAAAWFAASGMAIGFATSVRPYNAPFALLLMEPLVRQIARSRGVPPGELILRTLCGGLGGLVGFLPQLIIWRVQHGTWIANTSGHSFSLIPPYALHLFFHPNHGLFYWTPAYLAAWAGLVVALRRYFEVAVPLLLSFAGVVWMYGNWEIWWLGVSFGMRGFIDSAFVFMFGFAVFVEALQRRWGRRGLIFAAAGLVTAFLLNVHLITSFRSRSIPAVGSLSWLATLAHPGWYKDQILRDWSVWTDHDRDQRFSFFYSNREAYNKRGAR